MSNKAVGDIHWSFWLIGAIALVWNVMGVINFFVQMNANAIASFPEAQRAIIEGRPAWVTVGFAIAVFGGALGCLLLLLRKSVAHFLFITSLLGVIVQMTPYLGMTGSKMHFNAFEISMYILMPLAVAAFLIWYSKLAESKSWVG